MNIGVGIRSEESQSNIVTYVSFLSLESLEYNLGYQALILGPHGSLYKSPTAKLAL